MARTGEGRQSAPLRTIVERLYESGSLFERDWVRLECGHETASNGRHKARCVACQGRASEREQA